MITLIFSLGIIILLTLVVSIFFWSKIQFDWLSKLCSGLILSLPFEYFPRVEIGGASWRISQVLVIVGFWILAVLVVKKDQQLLSHKIHFASWYLFVFFVLSSPSWFFIKDFQRFIIHSVGTIFVFGAMVLLANFATNVWKSLQRLALVLFGCSIFGLFQFFGDLISIPTTFTLLREQYTKIVFGVPRIQGTAVEPLYFAGMLMIAIFTLIFWICERFEQRTQLEITTYCHLERSERSCAIVEKTLTIITADTVLDSDLINYNFARNVSNQFKNHTIKYLCIILTTILIVFVLTISKGTFGVLAILALPLLIVIFFTFDFFKQYIYNHLFQGILAILLFGIAFFTFVNPIALLGEIGTNFIETLSGTSASAVERSMFVSQANNAIYDNPIFGIGMGQYGDYVGNNLGLLNEDGKAIVNNVYLEIWLEEGITALFFFIFMLFQPIAILLRLLATRWSPLRAENLAALSIIFILVGYYIQWTLFSPIFIMPIFIILGLAYNLISNYDS